MKFVCFFSVYENGTIVEQFPNTVEPFRIPHLATPWRIILYIRRISVKQPYHFLWHTD